MNRCKLIILFSVLCLSVICCSCNHNSTDLISSNEKEEILFDKTSIKNSFNKDWEIINLPIIGRKLTVFKDKLYIVNDEGVLSIDTENEKNWTKFKIVNSYLTSDGGITQKKMNSKDESRVENLCSPEDVAFLATTLFVYSVCEHTSQLWQINFDKSIALLDMTSFTYRDIENGDNSVLSPTSLPNNSAKVFFPTFLEKGTALLKENRKTKNYETFWKGEEKDGGIVSIDFVGNKGLMLLSKGKFLCSYDGGENWQYLSDVPKKPESNFFNLKFKNENEGYVIGTNGLIVVTIDGGKTWQFQNNTVKESFYRISINKENIAIAGNSSLLLKKGADYLWSEIESKPQGSISDVVFFNNKLYVLIDGKLYKYSI